MEHELKCWSEYYQQMVDGNKHFELRLNDRDFKVGDLLYLREWNLVRGEYTGEAILKRVTYILQDLDGLLSDYCVMSLEEGYAGRSLDEIEEQLRSFHT